MKKPAAIVNIFRGKREARARFLILPLLALTTMSLMCSTPFAQQYPTRAIRMIVPLAPGGTNDIIARILSQQLSEELGQQVVIDNRAGAGGNLGTGLAAKAAPDGYTVLFASATFVINVSLYKSRLPYNAVQDFVPISLVAKAPQVLTVHPSVPAKNLRQLIALAKAQPSKLTYGSAGSGTSSHLVGELFKTAARINILHVPYKGGGQMLIELLGGNIDMIITGPPTVINHVKAQRLRALAVSTAARAPALPETPTINESGLPGFEAESFYCLLAPASTPAHVIEKLRVAIIQAIQTPKVRQRLQEEGAIPQSSTSDELGAYIRSEIVKWERAVAISGARVD